MNKDAFKKAFVLTIPVLTAYLFIGIGFGMILKAQGYGVLWSFLMSLFIYAGSLQYVLCSFLKETVPLFTVFLTCLLVNARHLFYGLSMVNRFKGPFWKRSYMIFALTDETYSLLCKEENEDVSFYISVLDHLYWILGSVLGSLATEIFSFDTTGIEFGLTALFVCVFVDQWKNAGDHISALGGISISAICLTIFGKAAFLIPSMALIAGFLLLYRRRYEG